MIDVEAILFGDDNFSILDSYIGMDQQLDLKLDVKEAPAIPQYSGKIEGFNLVNTALLIFLIVQNTGTSASPRRSTKSKRITKVNSPQTLKMMTGMINKNCPGTSAFRFHSITPDPTNLS